MSKLRADGLRFSRLRRAFLAVLAMATVAAIAFDSGRAFAQQQPPAAQQAPAQTQLNAKLLEQYIAAFKELMPLYQKLDEAGDKPDPKLLAQVTQVIKKYGFKDEEHHAQVAVSIGAVLDGVDPKTRQYTDPIAAIKKEIAAVQADKTMKPAERKKALESLNAELSEVQPVQHQGNIALVIKYYDQLVPSSPQ